MPQNQTTQKPDATQNGVTAAAVTFPVDTLRDAGVHLRRPFTEHAVKFKVQATWPKDQPTGGLIVAYIDARLVIERLNMVLADDWHDHSYTHDDRVLVCMLTVGGVTRQDVGEGYAGKGLYSDAFKRAAVKFGVGVSLYAVPKIMLNHADGHLKKVQQGKSLALTDSGERRCRELYRAWLLGPGQAFGDPLDHGDVEGSVGDPADTGPGEASAVREASRERDRPALADVDHDKALLVLLAEDHPLKDKRNRAHGGLDVLGAPARQQVELIRGAPDERSIDELLTRIHDLLDENTATNDKKGE